MKVVKKKIAVLIIFGLTLVSILAGAAYAQWTDSVKTNVTASTWDFYVNNTQLTYTNVIGFCNVSNTISNNVITATITRFGDGDKVRLKYRFKNQSTIPITIDNISIEPLGSLNKNDKDEVIIIARAAEKIEYSTGLRRLNETRTYEEWELDSSTSSEISNCDIEIGEELSLRVVVKSDDNAKLRNKRIILRVSIEYSVKQ